MKKFLIVIIVLVLLMPVAAHAFSFVDVINFGRWIFHRQVQVQAPAAEIKKQMAAAPEKLATLTAENKYNNWTDAFNKKDIALVIKDSRNLYFTDAEMNYLFAKELAAMSAPPVRDIQVAFTDNLISISGYSMLKNFTGQFSLEAKIVEANKKIGLQVAKAKYNNIYLPSFVAQPLLASQLKVMTDFLYSSPDYQNLSATVGNGFIELSYGK